MGSYSAIMHSSKIRRILSHLFWVLLFIHTKEYLSMGCHCHFEFFNKWTFALLIVHLIVIYSKTVAVQTFVDNVSDIQEQIRNSKFSWILFSLFEKHWMMHTTNINGMIRKVFVSKILNVCLWDYDQWLTMRRLLFCKLDTQYNTATKVV